MKKICLFALLALLLVSSMASAQPYENPSVVGQVQDRVVITVKAGTKMALDKADGSVRVGVPSLDALSARFDVTDMEALYEGMTNNLKSKADASVLDRTWAVDFPEEMGLKNVKEAYEALPEVELVRLVDICKMYDAYLPNDVVGSQYYLRNMNPGGADIHAVGAWNQALGDSNVIVAVIDSGVDWHHPDLGGTHPDKVNGAIWTNWDEYYGTPGVDDDSNGKIDDIRGWDFVHVSSSQGWPDEDVTIADNDPMDYESHGTNCAGCVAAITNNGVGIAGTAPGCKIMALRVGWLPNGDTQGVVRMDFAAQGIVYAANNGAKIINSSWGSSSYLSFAVTTAQNEGLLIVTAAGNDDNEVASYLGSRSGVMAVAATDNADHKASFSSYGTWVEISAPGVAIYTTAYNRFNQTSTYGSVQGTSFSSPITAGAAALLWSANPGMTYTQISNLLTSSADNIDDVNPQYENKLGAGRVNMLRALGDSQHQYPAEFPTIFDAMNSAASGDEIAVEGGISITGPLLVIGKEYEINGGYTSDFSSRDAIGNPTIVQGSASNSVLKFSGTVENTTIVDGFLIQGGGGQTFSGIPYNGKYGGGIALNNASPTLRNIVVTDCSVGSSSELGLGGGIMFNNSQAVLENVTVENNTAVFGAGVFMNASSPTLTNCNIQNNTMVTDNLTNLPLGGGLHIFNSNPSLTDCSINGHEDTDKGGGIYASDSSSLTVIGGDITGNTALNNGGGVYINSGTLDLTSVEISGNGKTASSTFMNGGGIFATAATVNCDNLILVDNLANAGGGAVFSACVSADVSQSVVARNDGQFFGGGLYYQNTTSGSLTNNTIAENTAVASGAAGVYVQGNTPEFSNNIIAFNTGGASFANGVAVVNSPAVFSCNDVFGNAISDYSGMADPTGTDGNISVDPEFCSLDDDNYNVAGTSPCDADNSGGCGLIGALSGGCGLSPVDDTNGGVPVAFHVAQNFPNPFNPSTIIRFALPASAHTQVVIYDVAGHKVKTLVDDVLNAQVHDAVWTGRDDAGRTVSAGVYFYRVTSGDHLSVGRMALVK
ncbi:MAG: S8 family serine peptidase [bacterium]|nr:S8 family serine peptidase [bacterium]